MVEGDGSIDGPHGGEADFRMDVKFQTSKKKTKVIGSFSYSDPASNLSFAASKITSLSINGNQAHFTGTAKLGRKSTVSFAVDVTDNGFPGTNDFFSIHLSNGYSAGGNVVSGDISIN
jgi:hypothetical protein